MVSRSILQQWKPRLIIYRPYLFKNIRSTTVSPLLQSATEFHFDALRQTLVEHLHKMYPNTPEDVLPEKDLVVETAILAGDCNVPGVLKFALYELARREGMGLDKESASGNQYVCSSLQ